MDGPNSKCGMTDEEALASMRKAQWGGRTLAAVLLGIGWAAAFWVWPDGITDLPLAAIRLGAFLRAIASGVIAFLALGFAWALWIH
jgi:hypothetical protein